MSNAPLCACGCGRQTSKSKYTNGWRPYRVGHNPEKAWASGVRHPKWNGGTIVSQDGYVLVRDVQHPRANPIGYVRRSWLVVEAAIGRYLDTDELVHHKNENKQDDAIDNLQIVSRAEHARIHGRQRCGEKSKANKLTEAEAMEIRGLRGIEPQASVAARFGITQQTVSDIQVGRRWKHLTSPQDCA